MRRAAVMAGLMAMAAAAPAWGLEITKGPYLMQVTQTSQVIMWETDQPAGSAVDYGPDAGYGQTVTEDQAATIHEVALTGLSPDTAYHYRVRSGSVTSEDAVLHTAVRPGTPFRFAVYGDNRTYPEIHRRVVEGMVAARPRIVLNVGDVVSDGTVYAQWGPELFGPAAELMREAPMYIAIGNHERNSHWFYDLVSYPPPEDYYSFDYGSAHFVMVDSNRPYDPGSPQGKWLAADLASDAAQKADWLFVAFHAPGYCEGWSSPGYDGDELVRVHLMPLMEKCGVDMVFNGHLHGYERGFRNGVYYVISGGGGARLDHFIRGFEHIAVSRYVHQYCVVDIDGPTLRLKAISIDGEVLDSLVVRKHPWPRTVTATGG